MMSSKNMPNMPMPGKGGKCPMPGMGPSVSKPKSNGKKSGGKKK